MNVLATKHNREQTLEAKGKPLGRVGIAIVLGFVGLVFATTFIGVRAATSNTVININAADNQLTATGNFDESTVDLDISWHWFAVQTNYDTSFNNSAVLSSSCKEANGATGGSGDQFGIFHSGLGSSATLNEDSPGLLYCFVASITDDGIVRDIQYGGYIPRAIEVAN